MNSKTSLRRRYGFSVLACSASLALLTAPKADALYELGAGQLNVNATAQVDYDSNVFANSGEEKDWYASLKPELHFFQESGLLNVDLRGGVNIIRFDKFSGQDTEDYYFRGGLSYPNRPGATANMGSINAGWQERSATNEDLGERTQSERWNLDSNLRVAVSDKTAVRGGLNIAEERFQQRNFSRIDQWSLRGEAVWQYSEKLEGVFGYRYRDASSRAAAGTGRQSLNVKDHLLSVGAEGQLMPKVTGGVSAGWQHRRFENPGIDNINRPYGSAMLVWDHSQQARVRLDAVKDFDLSPDDQSIDRTAVSLTWIQDVHERARVEPSISYVRAEYRSATTGVARRTDDRYGFGIAMSMDFAYDLSGRVAYNFLKSDSDRARFDYDRHRLTLALSGTF